MDIHAPHGPIRSLKEFALHILVVTVGILIALGLEGVRESRHEHAAILEARESFNKELAGDKGNLDRDRANVEEVNKKLDQLLIDLSDLVKTPDDLHQRVAELGPSFYFFSDTAWQSAVASGVISHMAADEANRYTNAYVSLRDYENVSTETRPEWIAVDSFFLSRRHFSAAEAVDGEQRLRAFQMRLGGMRHVGGEFSSDIEAAVGRH